MEAPVREPQKSSPATAEELHLLISELDDELSRYRWREAVWVSLVLHAIIFVVVITAPKWMPRSIVILPATPSHKQTTFLTLPNDVQRVKPPKTDVISDKNRIAQTRTPVPNRETLRKLLDAQRPGAPARPVPPPSQQAMQQQTPPAEQQQSPANPGQQQPQPPAQTARVQPPAPTGNPNPFKTGAPGSVVQQAIQSAAGSHGTNRVHFGGDYGVRHERTSDPQGDLEILSDTMGVDFGPYLQRVVYQVREHWYNLIPESAKAPLMKKGKLAIEFAILKDGRVAGLRLAATSGDDALDRPAWGSITGSNPFPPLPSEFKGQFLQLRFKFYYNPDKNELD
jgi:outer membrane biosynthesis protein TonB